jgi:hypothetical protein
MNEFTKAEVSQYKILLCELHGRDVHLFNPIRNAHVVTKKSAYATMYCNLPQVNMNDI